MNGQPASSGGTRRGLLLLGWTLLTFGGGTLLWGLLFDGDDGMAVLAAFLLPAIWLTGVIVLVLPSRSRVGG
jgi:hypothetical protein